MAQELKSSTAFWDFSAAVRNRPTSRALLGTEVKERRGIGQEPGGQAEAESDRSARARSWLPRAAVCGNVGPRNGIQEAEIL